MDKEMITVECNGNVEEVELINTVKTKDGSKEYLIYTKNEQQENGNVLIYVSELREGNNLYDIESDEEWAEVKKLIKELAVVGE